jgi:hypothetical protein
MIQKNLAVLDQPIEARAWITTATGRRVNRSQLKRSSKFLDRQILKRDVVRTRPRWYLGHRRHEAGLHFVAARVIVKVNNVVGIVKPPLASRDSR